jgi:hypothetical protein
MASMVTPPSGPMDAHAQNGLDMRAGQRHRHAGIGCCLRSEPESAVTAARGYNARAMTSFMISLVPP